MKKIKLMIFVLTVSLSLFLLAGCEGDTTSVQNSEMSVWDESYDSDDTWAIYWYLCGSDLESDGGAATDDLNQMMEANLPENVKVVIETGGAAQWQNDMVDPEKSQRFLYSNKGLEEVYNEKSVNMGSSKALENFLKFCKKEYPADHTAVILWNHGGGSLGGVAYDEWHDYDSLSLTEMDKAFNKVYKSNPENPPLEMIGFDACLMATLDTANIFHGVARYMVASEEMEPGAGWDYNAFLSALAENPGLNGAKLGKEICDSFAEESFWFADEITLSVIDLSGIPNLINAYHNFGVEALAAACNDADFLAELGRGAEKAENYGGNNPQEGYTNVVDLGHLTVSTSEILPENGESVQKALNDCVAYRINGLLRSQASGLSVYYPYDKDKDSFKTYCKVATNTPQKFLYQFAVTGSLSKKGANYASKMKYRTIKEGKEETAPEIAEDKIDDSANLPEVVDISQLKLDDFPVKINKDGYAVLDIGPEAAGSLSQVNFELSYVDEEEGAELLLGYDNDLDMNWDKGIFTDNFRGVWGAIDGEWVYMEIISQEDDYNLYSIPVMLNGEFCNLHVSYNFKDEEYKILGARRPQRGNGMSDKNLKKLETGDKLIPIYYVYAEGEDEPVEVEGDPITVKKGTAFGEEELDDGTYIYYFEMIDASGNYAYSEAVEFQMKNGDITVQ